MRHSVLLVLSLVLFATLAATNTASAQGGVPVSSSGGLTATLQPEDGMAPGVSSVLRPVSVDLSALHRWLVSFAPQGTRVPARASLKSRRSSANRSVVWAR